MRVSIVNCVSTMAEMMRFSDESLLRNAGHLDLDYVIVKWLADQEVEEYLTELSASLSKNPIIKVHVVEHKTVASIGYVPNIRAMINDGFVRGFALNEYAGLVNTDCYFGWDWLKSLVKRAEPSRIINSLQITKVTPEHPKACIITENLGVPMPGTFNFGRFKELYYANYADDLLLAEDIPGGYQQMTSMPYLFHRKWWEKCGPWEGIYQPPRPPDVRFFDRVAAAGAQFAMTHASIIYHDEAVARRSNRPIGAEHLREES